MASRKLLELQSDRIEMVLASHKAPARVTGGVVTPRAVQFHLAPALGTKVNKVQSLADELALALGASSVRVSRQGSSMQLEVPRDDAQPVRLLPLMAQLAPVPAQVRAKGRGDSRPNSDKRTRTSVGTCPPSGRRAGKHANPEVQPAATGADQAEVY